jgi:hypothetical protein
MRRPIICHSCCSIKFDYAQTIADWVATLSRERSDTSNSIEIQVQLAVVKKAASFGLFMQHLCPSTSYAVRVPVLHLRKPTGFYTSVANANSW